MFSLKSPQQGDSYEYTQHTIFKIKKRITQNNPKYNNVWSYGIFCQGLKNEFEIAVVNEPSVFELLKFYCILLTNGIVISNKGAQVIIFIVTPSFSYYRTEHYRQ